MKKNKKKSKIRLKDEVKRKIKKEVIKGLILFTAGVFYGRYALGYANFIDEKEIRNRFENIRNNVVEIVNAEQQEETVEVKNSEARVCTLNNEVACKIESKALEIGMSEEQALISIAISRWETGRWTSNLFINKNNVGGMYCNGSFIKYNTLDDGINAFVINLKNNYFDIGLDTIEKIKTKYCPDNAENDPNGLNKNWTNGIYTMLKELNGE